MARGHFECCFMVQDTKKVDVWSWARTAYKFLYFAMNYIEFQRRMIHGVAKSRTRLSDWTELNWTEASLSKKAMATHSSTLTWKIPWTEEPGRLQSMGSLRVGHDWETSLSLFTFMHWRKKWQPTPVFLPGESQGRGSLVGCRLWDHTESDTTEVT